MESHIVDGAFIGWSWVVGNDYGWTDEWMVSCKLIISLRRLHQVSMASHNSALNLDESCSSTLAVTTLYFCRLYALETQLEDHSGSCRRLEEVLCMSLLPRQNQISWMFVIARIALSYLIVHTSRHVSHFLSGPAPGISLLLLLILLPNPSLHRLPLRNAVNPLEQMRKRLHIILREPTELISLDPRPRLDVCDAVLALSVAGKVVAGLAGVFARELDLEHAVDAEGLVLEAVDGVCVGSVRLERGTGDWYAQGSFSLANLLKWFICPWYGAPLPCQKNILPSRLLSHHSCHRSGPNRTYHCRH